jgi:hypothetical protein
VGATALCLLTGQEPEKLPHQGLALDVVAALGGRADPALVEALSAMLQPDPERRASRIAPLLTRLDAGARPRGDAGERSRRDRRKDREHTRKERRADKHARRDARKAQRRAWKEARRRDRGSWGGLPLGVVLMGLAIARVAVAFALGVFVPLVLTLLSTVFGRALRESAAHVRGAGRAADRSLVRAANAVRSVEDPGEHDERGESPPGRARIAEDDVEHGQVRIASDPEEEWSEHDDDPEEEDATGRRSHRPSRTAKR